MASQDEYFLRQAIRLAVVAREHDEYPFAAVLVRDAQVLHHAFDHCLSDSDPTAHAELRAIREYCHQVRTLDLTGCTLYSSTEPCVMCSGAIKWSRVSRVVFSVSQAELQKMTGGRPKPSCADLVNTGYRRIEVVGPLLPEEGIEVFRDFNFIQKHENQI